MSCWIVGICYENGQHDYFVFDQDEDEAKRAAADMIGRPGIKIFVWDMFQDDRKTRKRQ